MEKDNYILLFDGVCNFCNSSVNFIIDRDPQAKIKFAPLQSETGKKYLQKFNLSTDQFDSLVLVSGDRYWTRSGAVLRIAKELSGLWPVFYIFIIVPHFIRDFIYNFIGQRRYKWFGQSEQCRIPTPELKSRFL